MLTYRLLRGRRLRARDGGTGQGHKVLAAIVFARFIFVALLCWRFRLAFALSGPELRQDAWGLPPHPFRRTMSMAFWIWRA